MTKDTMGTKLPYKLLLIAKEDALGRNLQDLSLKYRKRATTKS